MIFLLLFAYVFGGAIAGDTGTYLQYADAGGAGAAVVFASADTGMGLADDLSDRIFDRSQPADFPLGAAARRDRRGPRPLRHLRRDHAGIRVPARVPASGSRPASRALGLVTVFAFALCWVFTARRWWCASPGRCRARSPGHAAVTFGTTSSCHRDAPRLAAGFRRGEPRLQGRDAARGLLTGGPWRVPPSRRCWRAPCWWGCSGRWRQPVPAAHLIAIDP